jgi:hypothetical protein
VAEGVGVAACANCAASAFELPPELFAAAGLSVLQPVKNAASKSSRQV